MKKTIILILTCTIFGLCGCESECEHSHTHVEQTNIIEATCKEEGSFVENIICDDCHKVIDTKDKTIDKLAHTIVIDERVEPTFTTTGLTEGQHCSICGEVIVKQEVIEKLRYTDYAYECSFTHDDKVIVYVYPSKDYSQNPVINDVAYSVDDNGVYVKDGDGQINFQLVFQEGYQLDEITIDGGYKNLKGPEDTKKDNTFRITKITTNLSIIIKTVEIKEGLTINSDSGVKVKLGDFDVTNKSQLVTLKFEPFYELDELSISDSDVQMEDRGNGVYFFSNILKNDVKLNVFTVCRKFESFAGSTIDEDGKLTWSIKDPTNRIDSMSCKIQHSKKKETVDLTGLKEWSYQLEQSTKYIFTFTYISCGGTKYTSDKAIRYFDPNLHNLNYPLIEFVTKEGLYPCGDRKDAPEGCVGTTTINDEYVEAITSIYNEKNEMIYSSSDKDDFSSSKIKIRGNTSSVGNKKPYKLKLNKAADLLANLIPGRKDCGINFKHKEWVLLNEGDSFKQIAGMSLGAVACLEYAPRCRYINVAINGDYKGLYILSEAVTKGKGEGDEQSRVKISDSGYLIEKDPYYWTEDLYFSSPIIRHSRWTFKYPDPDDITVESPEFTYIENYVNELENYLISNDEKVFDYIDLASFSQYSAARFYMCSADPAGTNIFLYKFDNTKESKIKFGPLWDFGAAFYYDNNTEKIDLLFEQEHGTGFYFYRALSFTNYVNLMNEYLGIITDKILSQFDVCCAESIGKVEEYDKSLSLDTKIYNSNSTTNYTQLKDTCVSWLTRRNSFINTKYLKSN